MKLTNNEKGGFTDVIKLTYADLIAIGTGGTKKIAMLPVGGAIELCGVLNTVDIVGSTSLVIDVGTTVADPNEFIDSLDVDGMAVNVPTYNTGVSFVQGAGTTTIEAGSLPAIGGATALPIYIKVTDSSIASITAGEIVIGLRILNLAEFGA
jgi:hypothetical protein